MPTTRDLADFAGDLRVLTHLGAAPASTTSAHALAERLVGRWTQAHRGYHDARHLHELLGALAILADPTRRVDLALARLAGWFHDAVYEPGRPDNEAASAMLADAELSALGVSAGHRAAIQDLILHTAEHALPEADSPAAWLHDADLWILSAPVARFDEYCAQVRVEYAVVPPARYARERSRILGALRDRPRLYAQDHAHREWEGPARSNLTRELERLHAGREHG